MWALSLRWRGCASRTLRERHTRGVRGLWPRASDRSRVKQRIHPLTSRLTATRRSTCTCTCLATTSAATCSGCPSSRIRSSLTALPSACSTLSTATSRARTVCFPAPQRCWRQNPGLHGSRTGLPRSCSRVGFIQPHRFQNTASYGRSLDWRSTTRRTPRIHFVGRPRRRGRQPYGQRRRSNGQ